MFNIFNKNKDTQNGQRQNIESVNKNIEGGYRKPAEGYVAPNFAPAMPAPAPNPNGTLLQKREETMEHLRAAEIEGARAKEEALKKEAQLTERFAAANDARLSFAKEKGEAFYREQEIAKKRMDMLERLRVAEFEAAKAKEQALEKERRLSNRFSTESTARIVLDREKQEAILREQEITNERERTLKRLKSAELAAANARQEAMQNGKVLMERFSSENAARIALDREKEEVLFREQKIMQEKEATLARLKIAEFEAAKNKENAMARERQLAKRLADRLAVEAAEKFTLTKEKEDLVSRGQMIAMEREATLMRLRIAELDAAKTREDVTIKEKQFEKRFSTESALRATLAKEKEEILLREQKIVQEKEETLRRLRFAEYEAAKAKEEALQKEKQLSKRFSASTHAKILLTNEKEEAFLKEQRILQEKEAMLRRLKVAEAEVAKAKGEALEKERRLAKQFATETSERLAIAKEKEEALLREQKIAKEKEEALARLKLAELEVVRAKEEALTQERQLAKELATQIEEETSARIAIAKEKEAARLREQDISDEIGEIVERLRAAEFEIERAKEEALEKERVLSERFANETAAKLAVAKEKEEALLREQEIAKEIEDAKAYLKSVELETYEIKENLLEKERLMEKQLAEQALSESSIRNAIAKEKEDAFYREQSIAKDIEQITARLKAAELAVPKIKQESIEKERQLTRKFSEENVAKMTLGQEKEEAFFREQRIAQEKEMILQQLRNTEIEAARIRQDAMEQERKIIDQVSVAINAFVKEEDEIVEEDEYDEYAFEQDETKDDRWTSDRIKLAELEDKRSKEKWTIEHLRAAEAEVSRNLEEAKEKKRRISERSPREFNTKFDFREQQVDRDIGATLARIEAAKSEVRQVEQRTAQQQGDWQAQAAQQANWQAQAAQQANWQAAQATQQGNWQAPIAQQTNWQPPVAQQAPVAPAKDAKASYERTKQMEAIVGNISNVIDNLKQAKLKGEDIKLKKEAAKEVQRIARS